MPPARPDLPVKGRIFGIRFGRAERLGGSLERRLAYWVGAMNQHFASETNGSIALSEVIDGGAEEQLRAALPGYQLSPWYQQLPATQKQDIDRMANSIISGDLGDVTINYSLDKATADPWNMLAGISYDTSKRWTWRAEFGFIATPAGSKLFSASTSNAHPERTATPNTIDTSAQHRAARSHAVAKGAFALSSSFMSGAALSFSRHSLIPQAIAAVRLAFGCSETCDRDRAGRRAAKGNTGGR